MRLITRTGSLVIAALAALVAGSMPVDATAAAGRSQGVTFDVGTRVARVDATRTRSAPGPRVGRRAAGSTELPEQRVAVKKVFGADDRVPVIETDLYPWSTVAKLFARFPDGQWLQGSAVVVGERQVLTAGHLVHSLDHGGWAESVEIVPGYDLGYEPFGSSFADDIRSFVGWTVDEDYDYDIALLEMDSDIGRETGWLGLAARTDAEILNATLNTAGYPADLEDGEGMWFAGGFADVVRPGRIEMSGTFDAAGGQSGSGVWVKDADERFVVGVLSTETNVSNAAARISSDVYDVLDAWLEGADGPADLTVTFVGTDLPATVERGAGGVVNVDVENAGATAATAFVEVFLRDNAGRLDALASSSVTLAAGEALGLDFPVTLPAGQRAGEYVLVATIDRDDFVPESDNTNNVLVGPALTVVVPWSVQTVPFSVFARIAPGGEERYRFTVDRNARWILIRLIGLRGGYAVIERPDGSTRIIRQITRRRRERFPQTGEWSVRLVNPARAFRSRSARLVVRLSRR